MVPGQEQKAVLFDRSPQVVKVKLKDDEGQEEFFVVGHSRMEIRAVLSMYLGRGRVGRPPKHSGGAGKTPARTSSRKPSRKRRGAVHDAARKARERAADLMHSATAK